MIEYGFEEGKDFYSKMSKTSEQGGRPATDYEVSIDMAKEICMIQRTPEGKDFSSYLSESTGGRPSKEYDLSIDMAKEMRTDMWMTRIS